MALGWQLLKGERGSASFHVLSAAAAGIVCKSILLATAPTMWSSWVGSIRLAWVHQGLLWPPAAVCWLSLLCVYTSTTQTQRHAAAPGPKTKACLLLSKLQDAYNEGQPQRCCCWLPPMSAQHSAHIHLLATPAATPSYCPAHVFLLPA